MRFVCDSCRAQYMISDDKVGPKGVKVRCKKCGHTITVRPAGAAAGKESAPEPASTPAPSAAVNGVGKESEPAAPMPASLGTPPEGGLFTDVEEDEIGAVFDQVLSAGSQKLPTGEASAEAAAREASAETVRKLAEAEAEPSKDEAKPASAHEWYVAIDDKQIGPLSVEKVKDYWDRGEVGAESLCWRAGFSDWIPLSETAELASVLAPRPSKPVIVAPEPMAGATSTVSSGPVQSAFSAGKTSRGDSASTSSSEAPAGWKPSAASVLASLVKEENEALSKPPPTPAPALGKEPVSQSRLLDVPVPPPEPVSSPSLPGAAAAMAAPMQPVPAPYAQQPVTPYGQPVPAPYAQQPVTPYGQPVPAPYPPPGYATPYPPPAAPAGGRGKMGLLVGVVAGLLVVTGGAVVTFMGGNRTETPAQPAVAQQQAPAQQGTSLPPMPPPPSGAAQAAAPAAAPANPTVAAPVAGTAAAAPAPVAPAAGTAAAPANPAPAVAAAPAPTTPAPTTPAPAAEAPKAPVEVAKVERTPPKRTGSGSSSSSRPEPEARPATAPKVAERQPAGEVSGDDFDELFGTKPAQRTPPPATEPKQREVYVPPEPGVADKLSQSDIMAVVLANKPAIVKCVNEQKKKDPALSGKLVMRWSIQPSGKTSAVSCRTDEFRSTYMASCISGLIKGWTFPRHKKQGDPIDFPFTF